MKRLLIIAALSIVATALPVTAQSTISPVPPPAGGRTCAETRPGAASLGRSNAIVWRVAGSAAG